MPCITRFLITPNTLLYNWKAHCFKGNGPVSISEKTSFRKISSSLEAARFVFRIVRSLWNLTGTSAAVLPMCLSNFKAIRQFKVPIPWLRYFTRSYENTSFRILRRGPGRLKIGLCIGHGLQLVGIAFLWLVGLNIDWDCLVPHCIMGPCDQWEFPSFFRIPVTVPLHSRNGRQINACQ